MDSEGCLDCRGGKQISCISTTGKLLFISFSLQPCNHARLREKTPWFLQFTFAESKRLGRRGQINLRSLASVNCTARLIKSEIWLSYTPFPRDSRFSLIFFLILHILSSPSPWCWMCTAIMSIISPTPWPSSRKPAYPNQPSWSSWRWVGLLCEGGNYWTAFYIYGILRFSSTYFFLLLIYPICVQSKVGLSHPGCIIVAGI